MKKIALIGVGNIGLSIASQLSLHNINADIRLYDINETINGKILDLQQAAVSNKSNIIYRVTSTIGDAVNDADLIIVTAGIPRKPGQTREDLLLYNSEVIFNIADTVKEKAKNAFVVMVTNPLDAITYAFVKRSGLDKKMVVGMSNLDTVRFRIELANHFQVETKSIGGYVVGLHNDTMIPVRSSVSVKNDLKPTISDNDFATIANNTRKMGFNITSLMGGVSAYTAPAACALDIGLSYLNNSMSEICCSSFVSNAYGLSNACFGLPLVIGSSGIVSYRELNLSNTEHESLVQSIANFKETASRII